MPKSGDVYINQIPFYEMEAGLLFNISIVKIGDTVKVGIGPSAGVAHSRIIEQILQS